jgi:hypothetical protein
MKTMTFISFFVAATALIGCSGTTSPERGADPKQAATFPTKLVQVQTADHIDSPAHEPMVVRHSDGALFVAGFGATPDTESQPQLWKSTDVGKSWTPVNVGTAAEGARGNSDVDLAMGPKGKLYYISMGFDHTKLEGVRMAIGVSSDIGASWTWTTVSEDRYDDRPWIEVAPDGTAHAIWNDGDGVSHVRSTDSGQTWVELDKVHPAGGSSHLAIGPEGELAVRVTPLSASGHQYDDGLELIAVSTDSGQTWVTHDAPGIRGAWDTTFTDPNIVKRWVEPVAWDTDGALYHLWSEGEELKLGRSADQGATWTTWVIADDGKVAYFPYLIARGSGELAASWFSGEGEDLMVNVAMIHAPFTNEGEPRVAHAQPFQQDVFGGREGEVTRDTAGEYVPVIFLGDAELGVVTTLRNSRIKPEGGFELIGDRQGFTWRQFEGR